MKHTVVVLGDLQVLQCLSVAEFPRKGETVKAQDYQIQSGGKGGLQALAVVRSASVKNRTCALIACIGHDAQGLQIKAELTEAGVNTDAVLTLPHLRTGVAMCWTSENGDSRSGIAAGANAALTPAVLTPYLSWLADASYLLLQRTIPVTTAELAARHARAHGTCVVLDPASGEGVTPALLRLVDILIPNAHDMERLTGITLLDEQDCQQACTRLHASGIHWIILTLGDQGLWVSERDHLGYHLDCPGSRPLNNDVFTGALVSQLAEKQPWTAALSFALAAAACSSLKSGGYSAVPDYHEVDLFMHKQI